jgi:cell division septal protein FtsQ
MIERRKFRTKEAQKRERIKFFLQLSAVVGGVFVLFGVVSYGCHHKSLRLQNVAVVTDGVLQKEEIASVIQSKLSDSYLGLLPKDSSLRYSYSDIEETLESDFPRIKSVTVTRPDIHTLQTEIEERVPEALWCGDVVPPMAHEQTSEEERSTEGLWGSCYLLDREGYMYAKAPMYSGNMYPRYYGSLAHADPVGQNYLPKEEFETWQNFYTSLKYIDIEPQALLFVDERDVEVYLTNGLRLLVPRDEDVGSIHQRLFAVLDSDSIDTTKEVEYIDLRFGSKAFVKYYDSEQKGDEESEQEQL